MIVADLMTSEVKWCGINDTLNSAARIMWENDCGCVPIVDEGGRVAGIVTDRDICMAAYTQGLPLFAIPIETAMSREVIACSPSASLDTAHRLMRAHEIHRLLVADGTGRIAGILSFSDLANCLGPDGALAAAEPAAAASHASELAATIAKIRKRRTRPAAARSTAAAAPAKKRPARRKPAPAKQA